MERTRKGLIQAMARCEDCGWEEEDCNIAEEEAQEHAEETGHTVNVETVYYQTYNPKAEAGKSNEK